MGIQLQFSTVLLCTAVALQALCMPTATARPGHFQPQMYYGTHEQEQEIAENNGIFKFWYGTGYVPITTPRNYDVFALQVSSPDRDGKNIINSTCTLLDNIILIG